jgi:hypothetical protein
MHGAVHRLHRGVGQKRKLVDRLHFLGSAGQGPGDVALFVDDDPGFCDAVSIFDDVSGGERRSGRCPSRYRARLGPVDPRAIAYDGNCIVEPHHLAHALIAMAPCRHRRLPAPNTGQAATAANFAGTTASMP